MLTLMGLYINYIMFILIEWLEDSKLYNENNKIINPENDSFIFHINQQNGSPKDHKKNYKNN